MDKLKSIISVNKKIFVFLISLSIIALVFGSSLPIFLSIDDKKLVSDYLISFVDGVRVNSDYLFLLKNCLINNCFFSLVVWLLGVSIIGVPIVLFLFFSKCFILGFSLTSIILNYGFNGILFGLGYIFPHQVINVLIFALITNYSLIFSFKMIFLIMKKHDFNIRVAFNKYFKIFVFCLIVLILSGLYETFVSPIVLKFIFNLLGI